MNKGTLKTVRTVRDGEVGAHFAGSAERTQTSARSRSFCITVLTALTVFTALAACNPSTNRPELTPLPQALPVEVRYRREAATERLARLLREDSIPLARVALKDGYVESPWMEAATLQPTRKTPLGPDIVKLRGWVDPARVGFSFVTVEVVYRPVLDPSLPERELDRIVQPDHPVQKRVGAVMDKVKVYERGARSEE